MTNDFPEQIKPDSVVIPPRLRKEYGDIDELAESISRLGLIQPVVLNRESDGSYSLLAGGRRLTAILALGWEWLEHGKGFVYKTELSPAQRLELELEENIQRLDMTWQERTLSIRAIHGLKSQLAAENGELWTHSETAKLLGNARAHISNLLMVAKVLERGDEEIEAASCVRDALNILLKRKEDEGLKYLAESVVKAPLVPAALAASTEAGESEDVDPNELPTDAPVEVIHARETIDITGRFFNIDCLKYMAQFESGTFRAHTLTDSPFAIDMDNIQQEGGGMNVDSVRATHDVEENVTLLKVFITELFRITADDHYFVMFCDAQHWEWLRSFSESVGWKTQRWPLVWTKLHQCQNMAAQYNFTKKTEFALVCRKGSAMLTKHAPSNYYEASNLEVKKIIPDHPFVKPLELWQWVADKVALKGATLFEPFMGRGSMPLALLREYRVLACEIDEPHYNAAIVNICDFYRSVNPNVVFA